MAATTPQAAATVTATEAASPRSARTMDCSARCSARSARCSARSGQCSPRSARRSARSAQWSARSAQWSARSAQCSARSACFCARSSARSASCSAKLLGWNVGVGVGVGVPAWQALQARVRAVRVRRRDVAHRDSFGAGRAAVAALRGSGHSEAAASEQGARTLRGARGAGQSAAAQLQRRPEHGIERGFSPRGVGERTALWWSYETAERTNVQYPRARRCRLDSLLTQHTNLLHCRVYRPPSLSAPRGGHHALLARAGQVDRPRPHLPHRPPQLLLQRVQLLGREAAPLVRQHCGAKPFR